MLKAAGAHRADAQVLGVPVQRNPPLSRYTGQDGGSSSTRCSNSPSAANRSGARRPSCDPSQNAPSHAGHRPPPAARPTPRSLRPRCVCITPPLRRSTTTLVKGMSRKPSLRPPSQFRADVKLAATPPQQTVGGLGRNPEPASVGRPHKRPALPTSYPLLDAVLKHREQPP